ncbi:DUF72 domain-containing protein [Stutzerimonas stutzeri]|uniref:DUF72 domain-containing protein n=1 Tax=Stutzerimonas stutzeri TaxID=316 RepID=UPI003D07A333
MYPADTRASDFLASYCSIFNTVEGNTTLYAWPSQEKVLRWAGQMPDGFRFCAKFPRDVSQAEDLHAALDLAHAFQQLLVPLGQRVTPFWLQLPASVGPSRLGEIGAFIDGFAAKLAVEVRHPAFFDKGDGECALNRLLRDRGIERICLDTRALFSCLSRDPAVLYAQSKKPRLPVRPVAFSDSPQLRFVGHPLLEANDTFMTPWLDKVAGWIEAGKAPHVYLHTPDNHRAPELAMRFHAQLSERLPGLPPLPSFQPAPQLSLLAD